ncbi:MAG: hypothetical protein ACI84C_002041 [Flavobacteriales bacterium]|jgi:hypothetical protein
MRFLISICTAILLSQTAWGQGCTDDCQTNFQHGEVLEYELVYHWGFIKTRAGRVTFSVSDTLVDGTSYTCYKGDGHSLPNWDWFFHVNSSYLSFTDTNLYPVYFSRKGVEGPDTYDREYHIIGNQAFLTKKDEEGEITQQLLRLEPCSFDVISAIYYCRSIDFTKLDVNSILPLNLFLDAETHESYVRFIGYADWKDPRTDKVHSCIVFKPWLIDGTVFSAGENMTVYVSNTPDRIPLYIETDLVIGQAEVYLLDD